MPEIDPKRGRKNAGCIAGFVAFCLVFLAIGLVLQRNMPHVDATATATRSDACFMSQKLVRQNLKAPSTAEFPMWTEENCKVTQKAGTWIVTSYVDSQNGFGAMIRSDYVAQMTYNPSTETWTLTNLFIDGR